MNSIQDDEIKNLLIHKLMDTQVEAICEVRELCDEMNRQLYNLRERMVRVESELRDAGAKMDSLLEIQPQWR